MGICGLAANSACFASMAFTLSPGNPPPVSTSPTAPYSLLVTRDGTLWIGTFAGLASWSGGKLTRYPEVGEYFVTSLLEDREGTVWAGILGDSPGTPTGRLCAIRNGRVQCYGEDGAFGSFVWSLGEDSSGTLWAGAESGLWRWKPGPPKRYAMPGMRIGDLSTTDDGRTVNGRERRRTQAARRGQTRILSDSRRNQSECDCFRTAMSIRTNCFGTAMEVFGSEPTSGGLSIYTTAGQTCLRNPTGSQATSAAVSSRIVKAMSGSPARADSTAFESSPSLRFPQSRVCPVIATTSVIAATDGGIWVATHDGLTRWKNGQTTIFRKASGLPDDFVQSLYQDDRGRVWVSTGHGLAYLEGRQVRCRKWRTQRRSVFHHGRRAQTTSGFPETRASRTYARDVWSNISPGQHWGGTNKLRLCSSIVSKAEFGLHSGPTGGVLYFKDGQVRASYTAAEGWARAHVAGLRLDRDGALWAATQEGGLSRIKDGHVATLTTQQWSAL